MFESGLDDWEPYDRCLTFLVMSGTPNPPGKAGAQIYNLDTGWMFLPDLMAGKFGAPVRLRDNKILAQWEPMTTGRFEVMALEGNVVGSDIGLPDRISDPDVRAYVVSPDGFVYRWNRSNRRMDISDVRRLAAERDSSSGQGYNPWSLFGNRDIDDNEGLTGPGYGDKPPDRALVGNGVVPKPTWDPGIGIEVNSLGSWVKAVSRSLGLSDNRSEGDWTPEAAAYVLSNFGINVADDVDWDESLNARQKSISLTGQTTFDHVAACEALRREIARRRKAPVRAAGRKPHVTQVARRLPTSRPVR